MLAIAFFSDISDHLKTYFFALQSGTINCIAFKFSFETASYTTKRYTNDLPLFNVTLNPTDIKNKVV